MEVLDGTNLILSIDGVALAFSSGCKISTTTETGERLTKETAAGKWAEKFAKKFSEDISADGCVLAKNEQGLPAYDQLKAMQLAGKPIDASYSLRDGEGRDGKTDSGYAGKYLITSLELDGQAGDDGKYSVKLESCGEIKPIGGGLAAAAAAGGGV